MLSLLFAEEKLSGDSQYHCERCECKRNAKKLLHLQSRGTITTWK